MTENTEKFIPLEFMMRSQNSSGFPTIVGQILGHLDFDTLVSCRLVSKDFKIFLDDKDFWISCLDQVRKEYLDKFLVESNYSKEICPECDQLPIQDFQRNHNSWISYLEIIKAEGAIEDLINFTKEIRKMPDFGLHICRPFVKKLEQKSPLALDAAMKRAKGNEILKQRTFFAFLKTWPNQKN